MTTTQTIISSGCGRFKLGYLHNSELRDEVVLTVLKKRSEVILHNWSGYEEVRDLLKAVYTDSHTADYLDLMFYCNEWGFILDEVKETLIEIYEEAMLHGIYEA